jgi:NADH dehydrogenase
VAWLGWALVHLFKLIGLENRVKVFVTWAWHYVTWNSDGRIITASPAAAPDSHPRPPDAAARTG